MTLRAFASITPSPCESNRSNACRISARCCVVSSSLTELPLAAPRPGAPPGRAIDEPSLACGGGVEDASWGHGGGVEDASWGREGGMPVCVLEVAVSARERVYRH
jgi:hypothetical protein